MAQHMLHENEYYDQDFGNIDAVGSTLADNVFVPANREH